MKTPTLEEVKARYANAKEVKSLWDTKFILENINEICYDKESHGFYNNKNLDSTLWHCGRYAEIISYKEDSIVESVINQFKERSEAGIKKYGTTLDRNDLNTLEWINHAQQEAMDFVLYLEKLKSEYNDKN